VWGADTRLWALTWVGEAPWPRVLDNLLGDENGGTGRPDYAARPAFPRPFVGWSAV
jgi:hypothetical protein